MPSKPKSKPKPEHTLPLPEDMGDETIGSVMTKRSITEKEHVHDEWYVEARTMTAAALPEFIRHLTEDYNHDYGTICHAVAAGAVAAAWAVEHSPEGGITGFQAGAVMWEFIQNWDSSYKDKPLRLLDYSNMLYPQYEHQFRKTLRQDTWEYLQKEAIRIIAEVDSKPPEERYMSEEVHSHIKRISKGYVPFGYEVEVEVYAS